MSLLSARQPDTLRDRIVRYGLRTGDVAKAAGVSTEALGTACDRDELGRIGPATRKRYLRAIEKVRQDVYRRVAVAS